MNKDEFVKAKAVKQQIPELLLQSDSKEFGMTDGHDRGGIFFEFKSGVITRTFHVDTDLDKIPKELQEYAKLIMTITGFRAF